jgi:hypothetical protein
MFIGIEGGEDVYDEEDDLLITETDWGGGDVSDEEVSGEGVLLIKMD